MIRDFIYEWAWIIFMFTASYTIIIIAHAIQASMECL